MKNAVTAEAEGCSAEVEGSGNLTVSPGGRGEGAAHLPEPHA